MKIKELNGNFVSKIEKFLLDNFEAEKIDFISNNLDEAYHVYKVNNIEITIHLEQRLLGDVTTIDSTDRNLINKIYQYIEEE